MVAKQDHGADRDRRNAFPQFTAAEVKGRCFTPFQTNDGLLCDFAPATQKLECHVASGVPC